MPRVKALSNVKHNGTDFKAGQVFEVETQEQAKELLLAGVVKVGKDYKDPDKVKEQELDETQEGDEGQSGNGPEATKTPEQLAQG